MKHLSILVPQGSVIIDTIIGSYNLFQLANNFRSVKGAEHEAQFQIDLVAQEKQPLKFNGLFEIQPTRSIQEVDKTDLIIIPGFVGNMKKQLEANSSLADWIRDQRIRNNADIASLCRGAFLLADTGLMNGKACATHWLTHDTFRNMFPEVELLPEKVISDENGIYSSGGAYSFLNLLLYLIEKFYGRETAIWCSKISEIDFDRVDQNQFTIFSGQKDHSDSEIKDIQLYLEENYSDKISIEALASRVSTSSRNFVRRFKKATHNTPIEYLQRLRIEAAKKKLESTTLQIQEVMFDVGYQDDKSFRTLFKRIAGLSPIEYRNKYNPEMALV